MLCDRCGTRPSTRILSEFVDGEKNLVYRCDACLNETDSPSVQSLERPCDRCGKREGRVKVRRLQDRHRSVSYVCEVCAGRR